MSADNRARSARGDHDSPQPVIVRAGVADQAHLLTLIEEFYELIVIRIASRECWMASSRSFVMIATARSG